MRADGVHEAQHDLSVVLAGGRARRAAAIGPRGEVQLHHRPRVRSDLFNVQVNLNDVLHTRNSTVYSILSTDTHSFEVELLYTAY